MPGIWKPWRETDVQTTSLEAVIADLLDRQESSPVRVVAFNTAEGWPRNASEDIARELCQRCADQTREAFFKSRCKSLTPLGETDDSGKVAMARKGDSGASL